MKRTVVEGHTGEADPLLTPGTVARIFQVDPKTIARWSKEGRIAHEYTLGGQRRYRQSEVDALLERSRVERTA